MNVKELDVFQLVHGLTIDVYLITESFPSDEPGARWQVTDHEVK